MNATSRYILTATTVAAGLFVVGATANAIVASSGPLANSIGDAVVVPSTSPDSTGDGTLVAVPMPSPSDLIAPTLDTGGWATSPGSAGDDDDDLDDDSDDDSDDDGPEDESDDDNGDDGLEDESEDD